MGRIVIGGTNREIDALHARVVALLDNPVMPTPDRRRPIPWSAFRRLCVAERRENLEQFGQFGLGERSLDGTCVHSDEADRDIGFAGYEASMAALRDTMGEKDFDSAWAEGAALSTDEAIAYAPRGRGQRKRPARGWASLTPTERDVVRLVSEGLGNKDIATRLFVSPRTVQTHLTHVYTKLGLTSRVQLVQEAARHA
jgi:DNA-binding CsgD family transcriptional regulator